MLHIKQFLIFSSLLTLTACSIGNESSKTEVMEGPDTEIVENQVEDSTDEETEDMVEVPEKTEEEVDEIEEATTNEVTNEFQWLYDELSGKSFIFSSGAGAWRTAFTFTEDGAFSGTYSDANGPEIFVSDFTGQFNILEEVDEFTYRLNLDNLEVTSDTGTEEQDGEMTIIYVDEPHGFPSGSSEYELYLPYKPKADVSEEYLSWVYDQANNDSDFLNSFGLYNVDYEFGMEEFFTN